MVRDRATENLAEISTGAGERVSPWLCKCLFPPLFWGKAHKTLQQPNKICIRRKSRQLLTHVPGLLLLFFFFLLFLCPSGQISHCPRLCWRQRGGSGTCLLCCCQAFLSKGKIIGCLFIFLVCKVRNSILALKPVVRLCVILGTLTEVRSVWIAELKSKYCILWDQWRGREVILLNGAPQRLFGLGSQ